MAVCFMIQLVEMKEKLYKTNEKSQTNRFKCIAFLMYFKNCKNYESYREFKSIQ